MSDRVWMLIQMGRLDMAEKEIQQKLAEEPDDAELIFLLGVIQFQQNRLVKAETLFKQVIAKEPQFDAAHAQMARVLAEKNKYKEAFAAIEHAIELDPHDATYFGIKSGIHALKSEYKIALDIAEQGLSLDPDNEECRLHRSMALKHLGRYDEADEATRAMLEDDPEEVDNHIARGYVLLDKNSPQSEKHFLEALRIDPTNEVARIGLAQSVKFKNPFMGALLRAAVWLNRFSIWYLIVAVILLSRLGDWLENSSIVYFRVIGQTLGWIWPVLFGLAFLAQPIFDLYLWGSKRGVLVQSERMNRNIKWIIFPLMAASFYVALFNWDRITTSVYLAFCCAGVVSLMHDAFQIEQNWVRKRIYGLIVVLLVLMACLIVVDIAKVRPLVMKSQALQFKEMVLPFLEIVENSTAKDEVAQDELKDEMDRYSEKVSARKQDVYIQAAGKYIRWLYMPVTFLLLIACTFSEEVVEFLERRAPDEN